MKAKIVLAFVFCVAAAALVAPVEADDEATATLDEADNVLLGDAVKSLSRNLKEADETSNADKDAVEAIETKLDDDPADHMMRDLQWRNYRYGKGKGYYYYKGGDDDKRRRLQKYVPRYHYKKPYYSYGYSHGDDD